MFERLKAMFHRDMIAQQEAYEEWLENQLHLAESLELYPQLGEIHEREESEEASPPSKRHDV